MWNISMASQKQHHTATPLLLIPAEITLLILGFVIPDESIGRVACTCRQLRNILLKDSIWQHFFLCEGLMGLVQQHPVLRTYQSQKNLWREYYIDIWLLRKHIRRQLPMITLQRKSDCDLQSEAL